MAHEVPPVIALLSARDVPAKAFDIWLRDFPENVQAMATMQHKHLQFGQGFRVLLGDGHSQAAQMTLAPGESEGDAANRHRGADQWLFVVNGSGVAQIDGERIELREGTLVFIQHGEVHEIHNTGKAVLQTLNFYVPPAYDDEGEELPAGRR